MIHVCGSTVSYIKILFKRDSQTDRERKKDRQKDRLDMLPGLNIDIMEIHFRMQSRVL